MGSKMSDTDERLEAIVEEAVGEATSQLAKPAHYHHCENDPSGPGYKLGKRIDDMDKRVSAIETARNVELGYRKANARMAAVAGGAGAVIAGIAWQLIAKVLFKH